MCACVCVGREPIFLCYSFSTLNLCKDVILPVACACNTVWPLRVLLEELSQYSRGPVLLAAFVVSFPSPPYIYIFRRPSFALRHRPLS